MDLNLDVRLSFQVAKRRTWRQRLLSWPWLPWRAVLWKEATGGELTDTIDKLHAAVHRTPHRPSLTEERRHG